MKACILQPAYDFSVENADAYFADFLALLGQCDASMDLIVCPEYCDVPVATANKEEFDACVVRYNATALQAAKQTAMRCCAIVFINAAFATEDGYRNTTYAINRQGKIVGKYFKAHPAPSEFKTARQGGNGLDVDYSYQYSEPYTLEIEGVRYGFMTCYDFYFYEAFALLARQNVDVIIGTSHQRTDTHDALNLINRFLCYNTNAYLVRSSVSLGADSSVGGCSMIVSPRGEVLVDMVNEVGLATCEIDPHAKYYKAAGFRGAMKSHWEYIEEGRHPQNYRNGGSSMVLSDAEMPYPRICAHRGFSAVAPENSMPAFGAAVALGAQEIEFDLWLTRDCQLVSCHDMHMARVSDGSGRIADYTLAELMAFDFGSKHAAEFKGLRICRFEEILQKLSGRVIMNIHVKNPDYSDIEYDPHFLIREIRRLLYQYDCEKHAYIMSSSDDFLQMLHEDAPELRRCVGESEEHFEIVNRAIRLGCEKVQLFVPYFNQEMVDLAHEHGVICNVFYADQPEKAKEYRAMGIDTVLTNQYQIIADALREA